MGAVMSIPLALPWLLAPFTTVGACCGAALVSMFTSTAASAMCRSCNCQSSIATRVGYALLFCGDALLAWANLTPAFVRMVEDWSFHYIQMNCAQAESCFGVLAVHRITFALVLFHVILAGLLLDVSDTQSKRATIQNGWWGPKVVAWSLLVLAAFLIPNPFFVFWANYASPVFAVLFILLGLLLLVDVAHTWSETCLDRFERHGADVWKYILVGSTLGLYAFTLVATLLLYLYFAPAGCATNQAFITINLVLAIALTLLCIHPAVQEANPRSGLAQSSMVTAYCTYVTASALLNRDDRHCNRVARARADTPRAASVLMGAVFTFVAVAYSTTRAATQSWVLSPGAASHVPTGYEPLALSDAALPVTEQPKPRESLRIQAIRSAVQAGSLPESVLHDELRPSQSDDDDDGASGGGDAPLANDDERAGTKYNYTVFHLIFAMAACYTAMLLTDWQFVRVGAPSDPAQHGQMMFIGTSSASMWIRVVSSWVCAALYAWTLLAPLLLPDRFSYV
ncbi:Membrane protein tms1 [Malassezia sp. CBS 17886]|nr:Membrane protein tms1 [Malassezia sp. CBS 17886]